jgi:hypothetical protein
MNSVNSYNRLTVFLTFGVIAAVLIKKIFFWSGIWYLRSWDYYYVVNIVIYQLTMGIHVYIMHYFVRGKFCSWLIVRMVSWCSPYFFM